MLSSRAFLALLAFGLASFCAAEETRLGLYLQGARIGQATYTSREEVLDGQTLTRGDSKTIISAAMLGSDLTIEMASTSWTKAGGRPVRMTFVTKSGGRTQTVEAMFGDTHADVTVTSGTAKTLKRLEIPKEAPIVDDPMSVVLAAGPNARRSFYVLRPETASFVKNELVVKGPAVAKVGERDVAATLVEVIDPSATLRVFVTSKGDLVKAEGPLGIEMIPETGGPEPSMTKAGPRPDLAEASAIKPDKPLANPSSLTRLVVRLRGTNVKGVPSDEHQTARQEGDAWLLDIHPARLADTPGLTIVQAASQMGRWTTPDVYIPSDSVRFRSLAQEVIGRHKRVREAATAVQRWVYERMRPNAGIGVLRDASEILDSREGVCRDAAILAATIMRAGGVPTRLASGLVSWDGRFFYHAWVEAWDGRRWIGLDPSSPSSQISASHVKLSVGNVAEAFRFPVLDGVSISIERAESQ